ncbi:hypothetical protein LQG66_01425 [Bradyrhizobium ontarionense]|uniref:Uncharacterized protein n=1 Tax=Bradyrhizobium ontarionense TaxID=2898149 RepID=A0ABY3RCJ1_9BRAD|nr:hypothetical protein [Bradyrhizobium sp. A19]UFZ05008.1 hypothetical protein LQG66_01425 [Bradyrhizobium sp. A19]
MRLPSQTIPVTRNLGMDRLSGGLQPSDCPWYKAAACAAAVGLCADTCLVGPEACIACFAALGQTSCVDCLS